LIQFRKKYFFSLKTTLFLTLIIGFFYSPIINAQTTETDSYILGKIELPLPKSVVAKYVYDPDQNIYIFSETIAEYPISTPLVLTVKEFNQLVLKEKMKEYFKKKLNTLTGLKKNLQESQKNLLPELYVNSKFFESIFGSNFIDVKPQGSIGIDLGARFQKNDNPAFSPRNRRNFAFDFDQRITLSLLGKIGERLQITANYDTESTFDFQNLVKLEFNPPKLKEIKNYLPDDLNEKISNNIDRISKLKSNVNEIKNYQANISNFLNLPVSEDAIIQNIDIGNINMPLNSSLISGAQSLMGVKTQLKFGKTNITGVFAEQRSQTQSIIAQAGGKMQEFSIFALDYEADRHFFLAHYFRDNYDFFLENYPYINSPINITRVEVWITNRQSQTNNIRNIIGLQDLGESVLKNTRLGELESSFFNNTSITKVPTNQSNKLDPKSIGSGSFLSNKIRDVSQTSSGFGMLNGKVIEGIDYAVLESARKLQSNEYKIHKQLGYISLNQRLSNDEILGVSFQYTYKGKVYQVGEFANGGIAGTELVSNENNQIETTNNLIVKLLKSSLTDIRQPIWDLMMKNIYNTGAFELSGEDFKLSILYSDPSPINYISPVDSSIWPESFSNKILLNSFNLDRLNIYNDPEPEGDGFFDFIPGITVDQRYGRIIFPSVEPFGENLFNKLSNSTSQIELYENELTYNQNQAKYVFRDLYKLTQSAALESTEKNKFELKGRYKSVGGDGISIGAFNIPRGSVKVTAGGRLLKEGIDYTVNYQIGRVKVLDPALRTSNIPINISVENNSVFGQQNKRFSGFDVIHQFNKKIIIGGNLINLSENPLTQKANYGSEPVNNTMIGFNMNFSTEIPFLTRLVNKLPTIETEIPSIISFRGEVASLISKIPKNTKLQGDATVYIDDFEGAQTNIDIKSPFAWSLSSVPNEGFKGSNALNNDITGGYNRALLSWYTVDPIFYSNQLRPNGVDNASISLNTTRRIFINEIFPEQDLVQGQTTVQNTFDLAYFPKEKGPYNNNPLNYFNKNVKNNWGGIMRAINSTNFEQTNVEFIEFWLLDTFSEIDSSNNDLGTLSFHLGNISEDILKDGRKQYENGLPVKDLSSFKSSNWGKTPSSQSLLYTFNTIESDRLKQDVGLDGLNDLEEMDFYPNNPIDDPAGDNYEYFSNVAGGIIDRYKRYNGTDGNSPIAFSDSNRGSTSEPDTEDINRDQTMNTIDSYFGFNIPIRKNMTVGNHPFVTDVRENVKVVLPNGKNISTRWIQFKIPIDKAYYESTTYKKYYQNVNGIQDLRSIRFLRMVLSNFDKPVVLRFGTLDLVRGDWRRYNKPLNNNIINNTGTTVDISTVNILENENRIPINYILPPDIVREQINNNNTVIRQNEQSLSLRFCNLKPMDSRSIYKNIQVDLRRYEKLKMYLHAESTQGQDQLPGEGLNEGFDKRVVAFIRLGSDLKDNYYQIEIPLKPSSYLIGASNRLSAEEVWQPEINSIDIPISILSRLKAKIIGKTTNEAVYFDENLNIIEEFSLISSLYGDKKYKLSVKGNPSLGSIQTMMIGVKNPSKTLGDNLCGEVWFNELRIAGIENKGGWAAIGSLDGNLADLANFSLTGKLSTIGFGSIDQTPNQRSKEDFKQYNLVSNINLGRFFPKKWGFQIPLNYSSGETKITPEYDPFYQDILLEERLKQIKNKNSRESIKQQALDFTRNKSINLIGIRKISNSQKSRFYSPENISVSYSYNEIYHYDYEIENQKNKKLNLSGNYTYSFTPYEINPFLKNKFINKSKYFEWLKEFNLNLTPSSISVNSKIDRIFNSQKFREVYLENINIEDQISMPDLQQRNYRFDVTYAINHNISRSLRLNFTSSTNNIVKNYFLDKGEDIDRVDKEKNIWDGLWNSGDPDRHHQSLNLNYSIPFKHFPFLSFIEANYSYTGDFSWERGSEVLEGVKSTKGDVLGIVNTIQNANTKTLNGSISINQLYRNLGFDNSKKNKSFFESLIKGLTKIERIQFTYSENNGTVLPGYLQSIGIIGTSDPSLGYVFGSQSDIRYEAARKGWITSFPDFNQAFTQIHNNQFNISGQLNFGAGLLIDLNAEKNFSVNNSENFSVINEEYNSLNPNQYGNFGMSNIIIGTAFKKYSGSFNQSFEDFRGNRLIISKRLAYINGIDLDSFDGDGYVKGYGKNHQSVLIPAFLSAYSGQSAEKISLNPTNTTPLPNWNIKYTGLMKIKSLKKIFNRFSLTHGYRSSLTINNFQTNLDYEITNPYLKDDGGNFLASRLYGNINLVEQFNPLLRIDLELKNSFKFLAELKKDRALSLSLDNNILTESSGDEYVMGLGYRIKELQFRTNIGGRRTTLKGDLNIKTDISYRNNITVLRNIIIDNNQVTSGQTLWAIKISADYNLSKNLTALFFYDHNFSKFAISSAFPQTSIRSGITLRYNFGD